MMQYAYERHEALVDTMKCSWKFYRFVIQTVRYITNEVIQWYFSVKFSNLKKLMYITGRNIQWNYISKNYLQKPFKSCTTLKKDCLKA